MKNRKTILCLILAALSFLYYLWLGLHNSFRMSILPFWPLLSLLFLAVGFLLPRLPSVWKHIFRTFFTAGLLLFLLAESCILWGMFQNGREDFDYILVLGAGLNGSKPSPVLEKRLESALEYLQTHPDTKVIVSGGQGSDEPVSEAQSMKQWLLQMGIRESRILTESRSATTAENIRYSFSCILKDSTLPDHSPVAENIPAGEMPPAVEMPPAAPETPAGLNIGIVTSNFHVFRSLCIANQVIKQNAACTAGCQTGGIAAAFPPMLLPHYMVREFFTICVDAWAGNLSLF